MCKKARCVARLEWSRFRATARGEKRLLSIVAGRGLEK